MVNDWDIDSIDNSFMNNYLNFCKFASQEEEIFNSFKNNQAYKIILEHVTPNDGEFLKNSIKDKPFALKNIEKMKANDLYGGSILHDYNEYGMISPSTMRYIKNSIDIHSEFNKNKFKRVVEVGGGYGGLAVTMINLFDIDEYIIIDQPEVIMLVEKYISKHPNIKNKVKLYNCFEYPEIKNVDLFISNYALSELKFDAQKEYFDKIIKNSNDFYIIYNFLYNDSGSRLDMFEKLIENFTFYKEPEPWNSTIIFGSKK